jgi:hypothetical protein
LQAVRFNTQRVRKAIQFQIPCVRQEYLSAFVDKKGVDVDIEKYLLVALEKEVLSKKEKKLKKVDKTKENTKNKDDTDVGEDSKKAYKPVEKVIATAAAAPTVLSTPEADLKLAPSEQPATKKRKRKDNKEIRQRKVYAGKPGVILPTQSKRVAFE